MPINPVVRDYLMKKREVRGGMDTADIRYDRDGGPETLGMAGVRSLPNRDPNQAGEMDLLSGGGEPSRLSEDDSPDGPNPLDAMPDGQGMPESELAYPHFGRKPLTGTSPGPTQGDGGDYDAMADLKKAQGEARGQDATNRFLEGAQTVNDAFTGAGVDKFSPSNAVADATQRAAVARDYVLKKYRQQLGAAQEMNGQAALNNSLRQRQAPTAAKEAAMKPPPVVNVKEVDPLDRQLKEDRHAKNLKSLNAGPKVDKKALAKEQAAEDLAIGDTDGEYRLRPGYSAPDKELVKAFTNRVVGARGINQGIDSLKGDFRALAHGGLSTEQAAAARERINSAQYVLAPAINVFLGQGAMGEAEADRAKSALGTIQSLSFMMDAVVNGKQDPSLIEAKLSEVQKTIAMMKEQHADTLNMEKRKRGAAKTVASSDDAKAGSSAHWQDADEKRLAELEAKEKAGSLK